MDNINQDAALAALLSAPNDSAAFPIAVQLLASGCQKLILAMIMTVFYQPAQFSNNKINVARLIESDNIPAYESDLKMLKRRFFDDYPGLHKKLVMEQVRIVKTCISYLVSAHLIHDPRTKILPTSLQMAGKMTTLTKQPAFSRELIVKQLAKSQICKMVSAEECWKVVNIRNDSDCDSSFSSTTALCAVTFASKLQHCFSPFVRNHFFQRVPTYDKILAFFQYLLFRQIQPATSTKTSILQAKNMRHFITLLREQEKLLKAPEEIEYTVDRYDEAKGGWYKYCFLCGKHNDHACRAKKDGFAEFWSYRRGDIMFEMQKINGKNGVEKEIEKLKALQIVGEGM